MEAEAECKTSSFIDDSSVRTNEGLTKKQVAETAVKAIKTSEEFGNMTGTKLNKKKVQILVNDKNGRHDQKGNARIGRRDIQKSHHLGGRNCLNWPSRGNKNRKSPVTGKRRTKVRQTLKLIERTPGAFDKREQMVGVYAMTKYTYACGVNMNTYSQDALMASSVHGVITNGKTRWRNRAVTLTYQVRGHLVEPWQATRYTAVRTLRRIMQKREQIKREFKRVWSEYLEM